MQSNIYKLAQQKGFENIQQFAIEAGLPWSMAKSIWDSDISNRALKTLTKAAKALECRLEDLYNEK